MTAVTMKALKTFRGKGKEGRVKTGMEFEAVNKQRADELELMGLAVPKGKHARKEPEENRAAVSGPITSAGGKTGEGRQQSSSPVGRPQKASAPKGGKKGSK